MQRAHLYLAAGAVLVVLFAAVVAMQLKNTGQFAPARPAPSPQEQPVAKGARISRMNGSAFGAIVPSAGQEGRDAAAAMPVGAGGGRGLPSAAAVDAKMIAPSPNEAVQYKYVYKGQPLTDLTAQAPVYRRVKDLGRFGVPAEMQAAVRSLADLGRLASPTAQSFAVSEDRDRGYMVYVDLAEASMSFSQDWRRWPHPESTCRDEACFAALRMSADKMPDNATIVALADDFLSDYGIDRTSYGPAEVRDEWRLWYAAAEDKTTAWVPDTVPVVYPLMIEGQTLYEEGGAAGGLTVNVNVRLNVVDGVWQLMSQSYERSEYPAETDAARILAIAERGGLYGGWMPEGVAIVEVGLGDPRPALMRNWVTKEDGTGEELYVAALRFPVTSAPEGEGQFYRAAVLVPLIKDVLDRAPDIGGPVLMKPEMR